MESSFFIKSMLFHSQSDPFRCLSGDIKTQKKHRGKATFAPMMGWIMGLEPTIFRATI